MSEDAKRVRQLYIQREAKKGSAIDPGKDHNIRVIDCCDEWVLDVTLIQDELERLVIVDCPESKPLLRTGRLLLPVAREAQSQLKSSWESRWNDTYIRKLINDLHEDSTALITDPLLLRTKVAGEPHNGSYYVQDGNHRILAVGVFFLETGTMPGLRFNIGTVNEACFRSKIPHGHDKHNS